MDLLLDEFKSSINPSKTRIKKTPTKFAVFGGKLDDVSNPDLYKSERNLFITKVCDKHSDLRSALIIPESFKEWSDFGVYQDLLSFEEDLGHLTRLVLLFLESPGAFAELGAFIKIDSLRGQLQIVVQNQHVEKKDSFIYLGPLRHLLNEHPDSLHIFPYKTTEELEPHLDALITHVREILYIKEGSFRFKESDQRSKFLLIADLVELFVVLKKPEIVSLLQHFNIKINKQELEQAIFLLELFDLIRLGNYSNTSFLVSKFRKDQFLDFDSTDPKKPFVRERFQISIFKKINKNISTSHFLPSEIKEFLDKGNLC